MTHGDQRRVSVGRGNMDAGLIHEAAAATVTEHNLGLIKSFRLYKKACLWSVFLSTCLVMEGFDMVLLSNLFAYPPFQKKFGEQPDGTHELTAAWQSGLNNGTLFENKISAPKFKSTIVNRFDARSDNASEDEKVGEQIMVERVGSDPSQ